jgi:hypothetical protein
VESPIRIKHLIASYKQYQTMKYGHTKVEDSYAYLSEFCHPNAMCLVQYQSFDKARVYFVSPPKESIHSGIKRFCIEWLLFLQELLGLAGEIMVRAKLIAALKVLAQVGATRPEE